MNVTTKQRENGEVHISITEVTILDMDKIAALLDAFGMTDEDIQDQCRRLLMDGDVTIVIQ